jgi:excisionase family DNA binding protein
LTLERRSLSTGAAARIASCHVTTIWRAVARGELEAHRLGPHGAYRIPPDALEAWLRPAQPGGACEMRMPAGLRSPSDEAPVDQEQLRAARREAARANPRWQEVEETSLVRRAMFLVHADTDELWTPYRGSIWNPGSANVIFNADLPMVFYVDSAGDVQFVERIGGTWSAIVERQARKSRAAT